MEQKTEKVYFNQSIKNGLHWHCNIWDKHISLRLAGKPAFLLEKYIAKYWDREWQIKYNELLVFLKEIGDSNFSPFVAYINNRI